MNPWTVFESLITGPSKWIGKVESISDTRVELSIPEGLGGASIPNVFVNTSTTYSIGDYVFVEGSTIIAKAPSLRAAFRETIY